MSMEDDATFSGILFAFRYSVCIHLFDALSGSVDV